MNYIFLFFYPRVNELKNFEMIVTFSFSLKYVTKYLQNVDTERKQGDENYSSL